MGYYTFYNNACCPYYAQQPPAPGLPPEEVSDNIPFAPEPAARQEEQVSLDDV